MIGKTILHYKILEKLGRGGMGVVYKARDTKLDRIVALKFLPPHMLPDKEAEQRFISEAKTASSLDHPNICTIYDINKTNDGQYYIVMGYYSGETLKKKLDDGSIEFDTAINYTTQIAKGLARAHEAGIIHRDIKPANIIITDREEIKILDFGLAKTSGEPSITKVGSTVGTISYMSPEQTKGDKVDCRTDIWSLGVVIYEMLSGDLPFKGDYEQAIIYSILNEEVKTYNENPYSPIQKVINKSLEKNRDDRYSQVNDILRDLQSIKNKTTDVDKNNSNSEDEIKKLAVLPFINIRDDEESNYLGFAVADRIIGSLAYIKDILVRPSSAIRIYQDQSIDIKAAANELNVDFVLTGNYLKEEQEIRLNLELININSDKMLWREDFDVKFENAFKLQDVISKKVIADFNLKFTREENHQLQTDIPKNPLAYEYYLKAISYSLSNEDTRLAVSMAKKSLELDPTFAPAYSEIGYRYCQLAQYDVKDRKRIKDSEENFKKALSINNELLSALNGLAAVHTEKGNSLEAIELTNKALHINPNNAEAHFWLGYIFRYTGFIDRAIEAMETAVRLDPVNSRFRSIICTYTYLQSYGSALKCLDMDRESPFIISWIGIVYFHLKEFELAKEHFERVIALEPYGILGIRSTAMLCFINNEKEKGFKAIKALEDSDAYDAEQIYNIANICGLYEEKKRCFKLLNKCIEGGFLNYQLMLSDPFLDPVRDDPEFQKIYNAAKIKHQELKRKLIDKSLID